MRKNVPSTFILNVNETEYFFVEGSYSPSHGPIYCAYFDHDKDPVKYTANNFVEEHSLNTKIHVSTFARQACLDLAILQGTNKEVNRAYNTFHNVYSQIEKGNSKKPKLNKKQTRELVKAIHEYNKFKELLPSKPEISYEEDYEYLCELERQNKLEKEQKNQNKRIVSVIEENYENMKGMQRKLKYD